MERSRSQAAPLRGAVSRPKRLHREVEQKRRMRVAEQITLLRRALCDTQAEKSDTVSVLQRAVHFVNVAQSTIANLQAENDALRRERPRVVGDWAAAVPPTAAPAPDALQRDVVPNEPCFAAAASSTVMQSARDCWRRDASSTASPWTHTQNGVTYPSTDQPAHFAPPPSSAHASLPRFDMLRPYPQQPPHHVQQQSFVSGRAPLPYATSPEVVAHAAHVPPSASQRSVAAVETRQSAALPHSSPCLPRAQPQDEGARRLDASSKSYDVKAVVSAPRDLSNT